MISALYGFVWGMPTVTMLLAVGLYLSVRTGFPQVRLLPGAVRQLFSRETGNREGITPFRALCTALGATVGTGNLAGIAGAICLGGPGAVFWMWVCGFIGMATKFAEIVLACHYRTRRNGEFVGGPMYMIQNGMGRKWRWLAQIYSFLGLLAAVGIGSAVQVESVVTGCNQMLASMGIRPSALGNLLLGLLLAVVLGAMLMGGANRVGKVAEGLVPFSALAYVVLCGVLIFVQRDALHVAFATILKGAFHPRAFTGGIIGSMFRCMRIGCSRGVFSNEAGMGTASIAHASAQTRHPVEQGMLGLLEVLIDTLVICTLTALVILCSGVPIPYGKDVGVALTISAFCKFYGNWASIAITAFLCVFAFATMMGWGVYGARCCEYLFGSKGWKKFVWAEMAAIVLGATMKTAAVWMLADIVNGLMVFPTLVALIALSPKLVTVTRSYRSAPPKSEDAGLIFSN